MTEDQVKHMVSRFLSWKLPANFAPDGGIFFESTSNAGTEFQYNRLPTGTNLLDAAQADEMVRYMIEGMSGSVKTVVQCNCGATGNGKWAGVHAPECTSTVNLSRFMRELSDLSRRFNIGITGDAMVYIMERDDTLFDYSLDADSKLHLGPAQ